MAKRKSVKSGLLQDSTERDNVAGSIMSKLPKKNIFNSVDSGMSKPPKICQMRHCVSATVVVENKVWLCAKCALFQLRGKEKNVCI
jgi:hypothetical protein